MGGGFEPSLTAWPLRPGGGEPPKRPDLGPSPCFDVDGQPLEVRSILVVSDGAR